MYCFFSLLKEAETLNKLSFGSLSSNLKEFLVSKPPVEHGYDKQLRREAADWTLPSWEAGSLEATKWAQQSKAAGLWGRKANIIKLSRAGSWDLQLDTAKLSNWVFRRQIKHRTAAQLGHEATNRAPSGWALVFKSPNKHHQIELQGRWTTDERLQRRSNNYIMILFAHEVISFIDHWPLFAKISKTTDLTSYLVDNDKNDTKKSDCITVYSVVVKNNVKVCHE